MKNKTYIQTEIFYKMKFDKYDSTCNCEAYHNATVKYSIICSEYYTSNENLRNEIVKLQVQILELKKQIK